MRESKKERYQNTLLEYGIQAYAIVLPIALKDMQIYTDKDTLEKIINRLYALNNKSILLVGPAGCGKTTMINKLAELVYDKQIADIEIIVQIDTSNVIAGTKYRGDLENKVGRILKFALENPQCLLYFDELHNVMSSGSTEANDLSLAEILKFKLGENGIRIIGSTTDDEYNKIFCNRGFERRFRLIRMQAIDEKRLHELLYMKIQSYESISECHIDFEEELLLEIIDLIIQLTQKENLHHTERNNPDISIDIIAEAMGQGNKRGDHTIKIEDFAKSVLDIEDISPSIRQRYYDAIVNLQKETIKEDSKKMVLTLIKGSKC